MPVPINEFKKTQKTLAEQIVEFLAKNPSEAFSLEEIVAGVEGLTIEVASLYLALLPEPARLEKTRLYQKVLGELLDKKKLTEGVIRETRYFALVAK